MIGSSKVPLHFHLVPINRYTLHRNTLWLKTDTETDDPLPATGPLLLDSTGNHALQGKILINFGVSTQSGNVFAPSTFRLRNVPICNLSFLPALFCQSALHLEAEIILTRYIRLLVHVVRGEIDGQSAEPAFLSLYGTTILRFSF